MTLPVLKVGEWRVLWQSLLVPIAWSFLVSLSTPASHGADSSATSWHVGKPIVTYWAGPAMSDATARQMAEGGWNLVWCGEKELDVVKRNGLRGQLTDSLLTPESLTDSDRRQKLDSMIERVRSHPALYAYFITDEPNATNFPALGKLVAYLRKRDPAHLAYINLFPTYASNEQLGNKGDTVTAYRAHLREFVEVVRPDLISYDHYQFTTNGDTGEYFLNLALIREKSQEAGLPFLNIVQACSWAPSMRVPNSDEMRVLIYTSLAYGAQGISYYVYSHPGHAGGIANADGSPTALYDALKRLNREFERIAKEVQPLRSLAVYHAGMIPQGAEPLASEARFTLDPPLPTREFKARHPVKGMILGYFGPAQAGNEVASATHVVVVNLDYESPAVAGLRGPGQLDVFDANEGRWKPTGQSRVELNLPAGGGKLVRVER